jgi:hypothetical protein
VEAGSGKVEAMISRRAQRRANVRGTATLSRRGRRLSSTRWYPVNIMLRRVERKEKESDERMKAVIK